MAKTLDSYSLSCRYGSAAECEVRLVSCLVAISYLSAVFSGPAAEGSAEGTVERAGCAKRGERRYLRDGKAGRAQQAFGDGQLLVAKGCPELTAKDVRCGTTEVARAHLEALCQFRYPGGRSARRALFHVCLDDPFEAMTRGVLPLHGCCGDFGVHRLGPLVVWFAWARAV